MRQQEGSKLIIEDGANFTFFDGAQIELQGPNSILEIRGKVTVGDNATFTFSGDGRIVMDQFIYSGVRDNFWDIGENAKLVLEGPSPYSQVLLECKSNFSPVMENHHTFEKVTIRRGKVYMDNSTHISVTSPLEFRHIEMDVNPDVLSQNSSAKHGGLKLWGSNNAQSLIMTNRFYNAVLGIHSTQINAVDKLTISQCVFENNVTGIKIDGKNFDINGCTFENNSTGLSGYNLHNFSTLSSSKFNNNALGVYIIGQSGTDLIISNCDFDNNSFNGGNVGTGLFLIEGGQYRIQCSTIEGFISGICAEYGASIDISHDANNLIQNNVNGLVAHGVQSLSLVNGQNMFENHDKEVYLSDAYGIPPPLLDWYDYNNLVDFSGNNMRYCGLFAPCNTFTSVPRANQGWYNKLDYDNNRVFTHNPDYNQTFYNCVGSPTIPVGHLEVRMIENIETEVNVNLTGNGTLNLKDAVGIIAQDISQDAQSADESTAIDYRQHTEYEIQFRPYSFRAIKTTSHKARFTKR